MDLQRHRFVSLILTAALCFVSCCCGTNIDDGGEGYEYPSYFSSNNVSKDDREDLLMARTRLLSVNSFVRVSDTASAAKTFNIDNYGAKGDGNSDDTQAFSKAWKAACAAKGSVALVVSAGNTYLLGPITFQGPCKSSITLKISGTIKASGDRSDYKKDTAHWIKFNNIHGLTIQGGGTIYGSGKIWWQNSCKINPKLACTTAPTAVTFYKCTSLTVKNIKIQNAQQIHVSFEQCTNVVASGLAVTAPGDSPNTDGIHVTGTRNIQIKNCVIGTGDDCISIVTGSQKVEASDITCGPGHGISIGSLGAGKSEAHVSGVSINGAKLSGTRNGVRIKTWQGGSGSATNIIFNDIQMTNVHNPIIIDQNYCDQDAPCTPQSSAVQIKNVLYKNITGSSSSSDALNFNCSETHPCQGIVLQDIALQGAGGTSVSASCVNVKFTQKGSVSPRCTD